MPELWTRPMTVGTRVAIVLGFVALLLAHQTAEGQETVRGQIGSLNLAVVGVALAGGAELLWLIQARHRIAALREAVIERRASALATEAPVITENNGWVTVSNGTWAHHPDCALARGKPMKSASSSLQRCPVCGSDR